MSAEECLCEWPATGKCEHQEKGSRTSSASRCSVWTAKTLATISSVGKVRPGAGCDRSERYISTRSFARSRRLRSSSSRLAALVGRLRERIFIGRPS